MMKYSPIIKDCFNIIHVMKLCSKVWSSISSIKGTMPTGPKVLPLVVFTLSYFHIVSTLSKIFTTK